MKWQGKADEEDNRRAVISEKAKEHYDKTARELKPLLIGTKVCVQDPSSNLWDRIGTVIGIGRHRDYHVKAPSGRVMWRNRRFLRQYHEALEDYVDEGEDEEKAKDESPQKPENSAEEEARKSEPRRSTREKKKTIRFGVNMIKIY